MIIFLKSFSHPPTFLCPCCEENTTYYTHFLTRFLYVFPHGTTHFIKIKLRLRRKHSFRYRFNSLSDYTGLVLM